ncbi:MAG: hypothetical protein A3G37_01555 [Omnitrophica WOR_2 bacterium RIFCSPLOWO2_12_FULL_46_30]|nr:MAG: hypothetical protein A3G37_01555 [Omnitrophica WOR_2 bacterium RIFCSPLOWO2_12_FULL_46_30]
MAGKIRIGVLMGGTSAEREISLKSGKAVLRALRSCGQDALAIDIKKTDKNYVTDLLLSYDIGLAFLALHGSFGEDGKIQAILDQMRIPYTGSGAFASSLSMDKLSSRRIFRAAGLAVPRYFVLNRKERRIDSSFAFPLVVKPAACGSSIGLSVIDNPEEFRDAIRLAFKYDSCVLVEEYIKGREMTVGIFKDSPLEAIEIRSRRRFFDYKAKYEQGQTDYIVPAPVPLKTMQLLKDTALKAHTLLGCFFFSRVDIILNNKNIPYVLEVNTIPGFTATSLLPRAALHKGIPFQELVLVIAQAAQDRFLKKSEGLHSLCDRRRALSLTDYLMR